MPPNSYLPPASDDTNQPTPPAPPAAPDAEIAADVIRDKVSRIYAEEPSATEELQEAQAAPSRTKHQQFMYDLSTSGKDLAAVQTEWHSYYQSLPDDEKHVVWQEFYSSQPLIGSQPAPGPQAMAEHKQQAAKPKAKTRSVKPAKRIRDARSTKEVQEAIRETVTAGGQLQAKHHLQSLLFGLGMGGIAVLIFLFGFFNEVVIAPFVQPSRASAATPIIVSSNSVAPTPNPEVIIPKINVEIPADYSQTSTDENTIEDALESGIVHYPTTVKPGETGNAAFFGHSSNNIFNKGKYKFAFVLLHTLTTGDTFYLTYNNKVYVYKVIKRDIVDPSNVSVLNAVPGQTATATLITCDPPGTSLKRLVVVGQQITPDPSGNATAAAPTASSSTESGTPAALPGNGPTLLTRLIRTVVGKLLVVVIVIVLLLGVMRWVNAPRRRLAS